MNESMEGSAAPSPESVAHGFWAVVREAIRGSRQDFTEGSIGRSIILLAVPMVIEMSMESLFAVVDIFFVSKLGADAVMAVGITESMMAILYAVAIGLSMAATAMVARRMGEKDPAQAAITAVQAIAVGVVVSIPIALFGISQARNLLEIMGAPPNVVRDGWAYPTVMLGGNATVMLLFLINAIFRGAGDAALSMRTLWLANGINMVLDPCLIFGLGPFPELGVAGAAIATNIGRGIGVLFQLWMLFRGTGRVSIKPRQIRLATSVMWRLLRISGNGIFQVLVGTASWVGLVRIMTPFGSPAVAGYTIGIRIIIFALLPSWGMCNAAATMVGQGLGAGKPERAERAVWLAGYYNMVFLGVVGLIFVVFAEPLIRIFTHEAAVIPYGVNCLRFISLGFLFYAYGMVTVAAFNGAGDTATPTYINLFIFWLYEIPLAYFLAKDAGYGPSGVFAAITIAFSSYAVVGVLLFRRGKWKARKV